MAKKDEGKSASKRGLTPKQEKFCQLYIELGNASEAYRQSYNCSKMTAESVNRLAKKEQDKIKIRSRIETLQAEHRQRHNITIDMIINDLQEVRDICMGRKSVVMTETVKNIQEGSINAVDNPIFVFEPAGANKALELLGKHLGMFKEKIEVSGDLNIEHKETLDLSGLTLDELEQLEAIFRKSDTASDTD